MKKSEEKIEINNLAKQTESSADTGFLIEVGAELELYFT